MSELYTIRKWQQSDNNPQFLQIASNRNIWRNLTDGFPHPYTSADANSWISLLSKNEPSHWAIEIDGNAVGGIGFDRGNGVNSKTGHFGYWLGESYWGKGIMTNIVQKTTNYIFCNFDIVRLEAIVYEWNPASMRVLEKSGFVRESVRPYSIFKDGQIISSTLFVKFNEPKVSK